MKKLLTTMFLIICVILSIFAVPVSATTLPSATRLSPIDRLERRQVILDLRINLLENQLACLEMDSDNTELRIELRDLISSERDSLTQDTIDELKNLSSQIRSLADRMRETRGDIREILDDLHDGSEPKVEEIEMAYAQIAEIMNLRLDLLSEINGLLEQMVDIVQKA